MSEYTQAELDAMAAVGGTPYVPRIPRFYHNPDAISFGWIPPDDRTEEETRQNDVALQAMPHFGIEGTPLVADDADVNLTMVWNHPKTVQALGFEFTGIHQITGSCVGAGYGNVIFTLGAIEVIRLNDLEQIMVPFWPYTYGHGRNRSGLRGKGEGSMGTGQAEAARLDGNFPATLEGLPPFTRDDGFTWGRAVELAWSDGASQPAGWKEKGLKHLVKTTAPVKSAQELWDAIGNWYPVTVASSWGGKMQCPVVDGHLMNSRSGTWMHQMTFLARKTHNGKRLIWQHNQWGLNAHGTCPTGMPKGGFWRTFEDVDSNLKNRDCEAFAFSQFAGFPAQNLTWLI